MMSVDSSPDLCGAWAPRGVRILYHTDVAMLSPVYSAETYVSAHTKCQWLLSQMVSQHAQNCVSMHNMHPQPGAPEPLQG